MPKAEKLTSPSKNTAKRSVLTKLSKRVLAKILSIRFVAAAINRTRAYLQRRPHRSFRRTYRRDYERSLALPGYWAFTNYVRRTVWNNKKLLFGVAAVYAVFTILIIGLASQDVYAELRDTLNESSEGVFDGFFGEIGKAGLLLFSGVSGSLNQASSDPQVQQGVYGVIIALLTWLTTVWLLRAILAGRKPRLRDGIYNAGAPIVPTFLVSTVIVIQLVPVALVAFAYSAAVASGLLEGGVEAMLFWAVSCLLAVLSLYWITSTLMSLVVVTLPGMYPMQALKTGGDLVIGRRIRILLRLLWMILSVVVIWLVIMIPIILFDGWIKSLFSEVAWLPIVPISLLVMSSFSVVWTASNGYLLYRKVVDDDAAPA